MEDATYRTSDLYYAAFLRVAGVSFIEAQRDQDGRVQFVFEPSANMKELKAQYFNRTGKVSAFEYATEIRAMKSLVHL